MFSSFWQPVSPLCGHRSAETPRPVDPPLFVTCQGAARAWPSPGTCLMATSLQTRSKVSVTGLRLQIVLHPFPSPLEAPASWVPAWPDVGITACPLPRGGWSGPQLRLRGSAWIRVGTTPAQRCVLCPWTCPQYTPLPGGGHRRPHIPLSRNRGRCPGRLPTASSPPLSPPPAWAPGLRRNFLPAASPAQQPQGAARGSVGPWRRARAPLYHPLLLSLQL